MTSDTSRYAAAPSSDPNNVRMAGGPPIPGPVPIAFPPDGSLFQAAAEASLDVQAPRLFPPDGAARQLDAERTLDVNRPARPRPIPGVAG